MSRFSRLFCYPIFLLIVATCSSRALAQFDQEYDQLASIVAEPIFDSKSIRKAMSSYKNSGVMAQKELQRQRLNRLKKLSPKLESARKKMRSSYWKCNRTLNEIRKLDSKTPDFEGLVQKSLRATPALLKEKKDRNRNDNQSIDELVGKAIWEIGVSVVNSYNLSTKRNEYRKHYMDSRLAAVDSISSLVSKRYRNKPSSSKKITLASFYSSKAGTYANDEIGIRNDAGKNLTSCTLIVRIAGINAKTGKKEHDRHVHYIEHWPKGKTFYLWYPSRALSSVGNNQSADVIRKIDASIYCDQLSAFKELDYRQSKYDKDLKAWAKQNLKASYFSGRWRKQSDNIVDPAGFEVTYKGKLNNLVIDRVTIEASRGGRSVRIYSDKKSWSKNQMKWICHTKFNSIRPDKVKVWISFPGSSYKHEVIWNF